MRASILRLHNATAETPLCENVGGYWSLATTEPFFTKYKELFEEHMGHPSTVNGDHVTMSSSNPSPECAFIAPGVDDLNVTSAREICMGFRKTYHNCGEFCDAPLSSSQ